MRYKIAVWVKERVFPVIILRVYKHFFNISETWLIDEFIFPEMMWLLAKKLFSSCTQFEGRLPLEWTEFLTCSKKLGESVSPSQGRNLSPLLCSWAGMWSPLGQHSASLLQLGPLHRVYPAHLCRLNCCLQLGDQTFSKDTGGHRSRKEICFISGQSRRCGINTESLSFKHL